MKPLSFVVAVIVWSGTVAAAWWWGHRSGTDAGRKEMLTRVEAAEAAGPGRPKAPGQAGGKAGKAGVEGSAAGGESTAGGPGSVEAIIAQVKALMRTGGMQNPSAMIKALGLLGQIKDGDIQLALSQIENIKEPQSKMMLNMVLLSRWGEKDGPAALKYAQEKFKDAGPMMGMTKVGILSAWAQNDPDSAWDYIQKDESIEGGGPMGGRSMMMMGLFSAVAAKDPDKAFARLAQLEDKQERTMALTGIAQSAFDDPARQRLMSEITKLPEAEDRKDARRAILGQMAMMDPDKAMALAADIPADERKDVTQSIGSMLMMSDPKKGAAYMLDNAEPDKRGPVYEQVVSQWAGSDPNAAGAWLGSQQQGPELDGARASFSRIVAGKDPESAMEWAKTISEDDKRGQAVEQVYGTWKKKDQAAANASLDASGLTPERIELIRNPKPAPASGGK